jgi:hypothetical protein
VFGVAVRFGLGTTAPPLPLAEVAILIAIGKFNRGVDQSSGSGGLKVEVLFTWFTTVPYRYRYGIYPGKCNGHPDTSQGEIESNQPQL